MKRSPFNQGQRNFEKGERKKNVHNKKNEKAATDNNRIGEKLKYHSHTIPPINGINSLINGIFFQITTAGGYIIKGTHLRRCSPYEPYVFFFISEVFWRTQSVLNDKYHGG